MLPDMTHMSPAVAHLMTLLDKAKGEHWITFQVTGPKGVTDKITIRMRHPEVHILDDTHVPYLRAQIAAIVRFKALHDMRCWRMSRFEAHAWDWSDSIETFNDQPFPHRS